MPLFGFSTGAVSKGDFRAAMSSLLASKVQAIELSALRLAELEPLVEFLAEGTWKRFEFVSVHCPSRFAPSDEDFVLLLLRRVYEYGLPVIVHPDVIFTPEKWRFLNDLLLIENMDKRKPVGRTLAEVKLWFDVLPRARFCLDLAHARQVDPSLLELYLLIKTFHDRLAQIHISEVNTVSHHEPISDGAVAAFASIADLLPQEIPVIIESLIDSGQSTILREMEQAQRALLIECTMAES